MNKSIADQVIKVMTHSRLRTKVSKWFMERGAHVQNIETNEGGVPDMNVCLQGKEHWIEIKVGKDKLSALQETWIEDRIKTGGSCWVVSVTEPTGTTVYTVYRGNASMYLNGDKVMRTMSSDRLDEVLKLVAGI